jgi:mandelamide amidase
MQATAADNAIGLSATEAVAAMRSGELRCEDYARALLDRARQLARLNAFRTLDADRLLEAAAAADRRRAAGERLGRLHGLPIPVKDSVNTRDLPTSNGTRALEDFQPRQDAAILAPLLAEGAIVMGKTNVHELSRGWTGNNGAFGAILNPYDPGRIPGGSSGGSAAAVAARMAPLAIAEDTLGSIRVPASFCGVIGLRPTFGRYPGEGILPLTLDKFDQVGPLARVMADIALFDEVVAGGPPIEPARLQGVRLGVCDFLWSDLDEEVERLGREMLARLQAGGAELVPCEIPEVAKDAYNVARQVIGFENVQSISGFLDAQRAPARFEEVRARLSPNLQDAYRLTFERVDYEAALVGRDAIQARMRAFMAAQRLEALVFPAVLTAAPPLGDNPDIALRGRRVPQRYVMARNTALSSVTAFPSLTLPAGLTREGLPVGIEFLARSGEDRALVALGLAIEHVNPPLPPPRTA